MTDDILTRKPKTKAEALALITELRAEIRRRPKLAVVSRKSSGDIVDMLGMPETQRYVETGATYTVSLTNDVGTVYSFLCCVPISPVNTTIKY